MSERDEASCPSTMELEGFLAGGRADEGIARHAASCDRCAAELAEIAANNDLFDRVVESDLAAPDAASDGGGATGLEHVPDAVEGYEILEEIERGGQGVVYRARQIATSRVVALKVLLAGAFATSRQRRRFEREIELVAGLEHPHIVTVYDSGTTRGGCLFLAMRHVDGTPLDAWRRARPQAGRAELEARLRLFAMICDGVGFAHQHGVIHRDLKPANVLVDAEDRPHILDFGLARPIEEAADAERATMTVDGAFLGTLAYAAPEQTRGDPALVDVRTDVYALGVILYELLTGAFPYPVEGELSAVLDAIKHAEPAPAGGRRGAGALLRVDGELDTIARTALAKEKERRYRSVAALRDDVVRYLAGEPIEAKRDSGWYLLRKTLARYRVQLAVAAAFVMLLAAFAVSVLVQDRAVRREADKLRQVNIFLEDTLGSVTPAQAGGDVTVRELLDEAVPWIDIALGDRPEVAASIRSTVGNGYRGLGLLDRAETQLEAALALRTQVHGPEHAEVAQSLNALGLLRRDQGRLDEAEELVGRALAMRRRLLGDESYEVSLTLASLGLIRLRRGDADGAERLLNESLAIRRRLFGDAHPDVAMALFSLAQVSAQRGDLEEAETRHRAALAIRRATLHRHHPDLARSLEALGGLRLEAGDPEEARALLAECLELRAQALPPRHWLVAETEGRLGEALAAAGRYAEAEPHVLAGAEGLRAAIGPEDGRTRAARRRAVALYEAWGRPEDAARFEAAGP